MWYLNHPKRREGIEECQKWNSVHMYDTFVASLREINPKDYHEFLSIREEYARKWISDKFHKGLIDKTEFVRLSQTAFAHHMMVIEKDAPREFQKETVKQYDCCLKGLPYTRPSDRKENKGWF